MCKFWASVSPWSEHRFRESQQQLWLAPRKGGESHRPPSTPFPHHSPGRRLFRPPFGPATQAFRHVRPPARFEPGPLRQQAQFLHKRWWLLQGAVLVLLWWLLQSAGTAYEVQRATGTLAPLFVVLVLPELWKTRSSGALEIECTRLLLPAANLRRPDGSVWSGGPGSAHPVLLRRPAGRAGHPAGPHHPFSAPFLVTGCICLRTLSHRRDTVCYAALPLCLAWTAVWVLLILSDQVYRMISLPMWLGMLLLATVYFLYAIRKLQNTCETIWEVSPVWH